MKLHVASVTSTESGRVYAMAHPANDHGASPIFEITNSKAKQIHLLADVEDLVGRKNQLFAIGSSFEDGPQVHVFDGKKWTTHATGDASIHTGVVVDDQLIGIGRDGYVGTWNKTKWQLATKAQYNLMLTGATYDGKTLVVAGYKAGKGILGTVAAGKIKPGKLPTKVELLGLTRLGTGELLATGRAGTVLVGRPDAMRLVAGKLDADLANAVEWDGKVLIAARADGVVEYANDALRVFSKEPSQRLAIAGGQLWTHDRKSGLASWTGKAWSSVTL